MLFHRRQYAEIALKPHGVVVADIILNHIYKSFSICELISVVSFTLENAPKAFHGAVVNAVGHSGHTLSHPGCFKLRMKHSVGILESSVAVEDRMGVWICLYSGIKCVIYQRVVVIVSDYISDDASVIEIKNGTEIDLALFAVLVPLELRNIRQPFFIRLVRMEVPVKYIFCQKLRVRSIPGTALVRILDGGLYITAAADPQSTLVADADIVVSFEIITDPTVTFVRSVRMDLLGKIRNALVFFLSLGQLSCKPVVVSVSGYMQNVATRFYGITKLLVAVPDGYIQITLSYL